MQQPVEPFIPQEYVEARRAQLSGNLPQADKLYCLALAERFDDPLLLFLAGTTKMQMQQYGPAIAFITRSVEIDPSRPEAFSNLGLCLKNVGNNEMARMALDRALKLDDHPDAWNNLATLAINAGCPEEALRCTDRALATGGGLLPQAHWNRALALLELGDYAEGWKEYGWGLRTGGIPNRQYDAAPWYGQECDTLIVYGEQGVGDEVMFGSLIPFAMERCKTLILDCHPRLVEMFKRTFPTANVYGTRKSAEVAWRYDYDRIDGKIAMSQIAKFCRNSREEFPGTPYLKTDPARDAEMKKRVGQLPGLTVGVSWQGGTPSTHMNDRSIIPFRLSPIFDVPNCSFVSLQYGKDAASVTGMMSQRGVQLHHWQPFIDDFDTLTSLANACDVVVTVDQTLVWQCGAIGKECFVLLPKNCSWRYPAKFGEETPWFQSIKLLRQGDDREWMPVINRAAEIVRERSEEKCKQSQTAIAI